MKLARIKRFNHIPLAGRRRKAYIANGSVSLYNAHGWQFGNTYHRYEDTYPLTRKYLCINLYTLKFKDSHRGIVNNIEKIRNDLKSIIKRLDNKVHP